MHTCRLIEALDSRLRGNDDYVSAYLARIKRIP